MKLLISPQKLTLTTHKVWKGKCRFQNLGYVWSGVWPEKRRGLKVTTQAVTVIQLRVAHEVQPSVGPEMLSSSFGLLFLDAEFQHLVVTTGSCIFVFTNLRTLSMSTALLFLLNVFPVAAHIVAFVIFLLAIDIIETGKPKCCYTWALKLNGTSVICSVHSPLCHWVLPCAHTYCTTPWRDFFSVFSSDIMAPSAANTAVRQWDGLMQLCTEPLSKSHWIWELYVQSNHITFQ